MPRMDELRSLEARGLARARARSRRRRLTIIRSRTIRGSLGLFAIFWTIIFVQLATGNDPALSRSKGAHGKVAAAHEARASAAPGPEAATPAAAPPEPESELESERELEAEREAEWEPDPEWESEWEPEPEPVVPIITSAS
jgi:hypothetical protein